VPENRNVYLTNQDFASNEAHNAKFERIRNKTPEGPAKYAEALDFELWVRILDVNNAKEDRYAERNVRLN